MFGENENWLKLDKSIGQLTRRIKYIYIVESSKKYFVT